MIAALPNFNAVTSPSASTFAIVSSLEVHLTFLFVAFSGVIVAISISLPPRLSNNLLAFNEILSTNTTSESGGVSSPHVTTQVAVFAPSSVTTRIVVLPDFKAVILPLSSTVATLGSLEIQISFLFVASAGVMAATKVSL